VNNPSVLYSLLKPLKPLLNNVSDHLQLGFYLQDYAAKLGGSDLRLFPD
jgi:hypothetical protein